MSKDMGRNEPKFTNQLEAAHWGWKSSWHLGSRSNHLCTTPRATPPIMSMNRPEHQALQRRLFCQEMIQPWQPFRGPCFTRKSRKLRQCKHTASSRSNPTPVVSRPTMGLLWCSLLTPCHLTRCYTTRRTSSQVCPSSKLQNLAFLALAKPLDLPLWSLQWLLNNYFQPWCKYQSACYTLIN